jgi:hypothetical protein
MADLQGCSAWRYPELFENPAFTKTISNSILWAANQ